MAVKTEVMKIESAEEAPLAAARGVEVLAGGGLVAFPTETVYGLAANAAIDAAFERLRTLKNRPVRPFTVHIGQVEQVKAYVADPPAPARWMMRKAWPGPITIVLPTGGRLASEAWNQGDLARRITHEGTIALRCPDHPVARFLLSAFAEPIVAPSANLAGRKPATSAQEVLEALDGKIDLVLDAGKVRYGLASTIVAFEPDGRYRVVREGVVPRSAVEQLTRWQVLLVCSGNTCRSPLGEALTRKVLSEKLGVQPEELESRGWRVVSAGTSAVPGSPASQGAIATARRLGLDLSAHVSRRLTDELIRTSDLILCMTDRHVEAVLAQAPSAADRVVRLDPHGDVPDPIGGSAGEYVRTAETIGRALEARVDLLTGRKGPGEGSAP